LLSTYNGERFIASQLESLQAQSEPRWQLHARDDGSCDHTVAILERHAARDERIHLEVGGVNLGVTRSFLQLLCTAPADCEAYFFCDQDDFWHPNKISAALDVLTADRQAPALYCSRQRLVNAAGTEVALSRIPPVLGLANALVENSAIGCTMALNNSLRTRIVQAIPERAIMHDWWCYLIASALGAVHYDAQPRIDYRQHDGNTVGAATGMWSKWHRRIGRRLRRPRAVVLRSDQAAELLRLKGSSLSPERRSLVEAFVGGRRSLRKRLGILRRQDLKCGSLSDQIIMNAQILLNDY